MLESESASFYPSWESDFQEKASAAAANIGLIEKNSEELSSMLVQRPLESSAGPNGSNKDQPIPNAKEMQLQKETSYLAQETKALMHEMRRYLMENKDNRVARIQFDRLADNFASSLHEFQQYQRGAVSRERTKFTPSAADMQAMAEGDARDNDGECVEENALNPASSQTQKLISLEQSNLDMLEERKNAVQSLEKEIRDVNDIFKDLALLVHEQGEVVDSIEASIETGDLNLTAGLDELERARRKANKRRTRKMIIYTAVGMFFGLIVLSIILGSAQ